MRCLFKLRKNEGLPDTDQQPARWFALCFGLLMLVALNPSASALTRMAYDIEPNDALHQAIDLSVPAGKDRIRVIGELSGQDQDAYRLLIDEDMAGRRINIELTGRGGALTRLDIFDLTELADGRGRIPAELPQKPPMLATLASTDGVRPIGKNALLLSPGVYILAVSHSGGEGAYALELSAHDDARLTVLDAEQAHELSLRGRTTTWSSGDQSYVFELNEEQAQQAWDLTFQTPLGQEAVTRLLAAEGTELFSVTGDHGLPNHRPGLKLAAGAYRVELESSMAGAKIFDLRPGAAAPADGFEVEPNDRTPTPIAFGQDIQGRLDDVDSDLLRFAVDDDQTRRLFDLEITAAAESELEVCLLHLIKKLNFCRRGVAGATALRDLRLQPGDYQIRIADRKRVGTDWSLRWLERGEIQAGQEAEPNDDPEQAVALHERGFGRGRFIGNESDQWRFSIAGEPQLWRLQLQGDDIHELRLSNADNRQIAVQRAGNNTRVRLDNQFLMPGDYLITVAGTDAEYTVRLQPLGAPPEGMEMEPNDDVASARVMRFGQQYTGTLAETGDVDRYRIRLLGPERFRLAVQPPADGSMQAWIGAGDEAGGISEIRNNNLPGAPLVWDLSLPAGDYVLTLKPGTVSDAEYNIDFERLDWLAAPMDREPNHLPDLANPLPPDGRIEGSAGDTHFKRDWYRLPTVQTATVLELPIVSGLTLGLRAESTAVEQRFEQDRARTLQAVTLEPDERYLLSISGSGEYAFDLSVLRPEFAPDPSVADDLANAVEFEFELDRNRIQAFSPWSQRVDGQFVVRASDAISQTQMFINTHLTHSNWRIDGLPETIDLQSATPQRIPFSVHIAPDVPMSPSVQLSFELGDLQRPGQTLHANGEITAALNAAPANPEYYWAVPDALRGGFNAAATRFGAEPVASPGLQPKHVESMPLMLDGLASYGRWTGYLVPTGRDGKAGYGQPTVRLAGEAAVPVRGFLINPTSVMSVEHLLKAFAVAVSLDGEHFETVLTATLKPLLQEQAFALDQPVPARYVRLIPLSANLADSGSTNGVRLGEFKVIAESGWRPQAEPLNVADPALGGHLVWSDPWNMHAIGDVRMLIDDDQAGSIHVGSAVGQVQLVLGFEHARAAHIDSVAIRSLPSDGYVRPSTIRILSSRVSPLGPWDEIQTADWDADELNISFAAPVWARYLRLVFELDEAVRSIELPDRIAVYEVPGDSVAGEWGHLSNQGPFEASDTPVYAGLTGSPAHDSRDKALPLQPGAAAPGRALLDQYSSWYRLTVPNTDNQLELTLSGRPSLEGMPRLLDSENSAIELYPNESDGITKTWQAWVEPGADYWLEIFEPPRSVIFSWDTSGSVAAWLPTIFSALIHYAESIVPGRDEVNLLPFGYTRPLLENWVGQPYPLLRMMTSYPRETSSSDAEGTLAAAARQMIDRPGKKAVLLLTDAATGSAQQLWPSLQQGQPQVFSMKLSSEGAFSGNPATELDLMQDWAQVRGGHFQYVTGFGSLAQGFDRAVAWLKRPVDFSVEVDFAQVDDPAPATLSVIAGEAGLDPAARGAIAVILDASGSMLKRMQGSRRIDIAKAALRRTVEESLPEGLPLALRVYGHREAGSCRTDLEIPLAPLNKADFLSRLEPIEAINLARTPIADSIAAVKSDLAAAEGRKLVVLLTDGEETCEGDPAAAIAALQAAGVDVRINIVGFAIDDETLKAQFTQWAELGGGDYLDAADAEGLDAALEQSLRTPFIVRDPSGLVVADGTVDGEPVQLPPGRYRLEIEIEGSNRAQDLMLAPGDEQVIEVQ